MGASGSVTQLEHIPQHSMFKGSLVPLCPRVLVLEGRAFLQGTARLATHLVPCLCPWEDAAMLVTHARGRSLGLAALSLPGSAKFPLLAAPCPQNCSGMLTSWLWCWSCKSSQNGLLQENSSPTVPPGSFAMAQPMPRLPQQAATPAKGRARSNRALLSLPKEPLTSVSFPLCLCLLAGPTHQPAVGHRDRVKQPPQSWSHAGAAMPCSTLNHTVLGCIPAKIINQKSHHLHLNPQRAEVCDGFKGLYKTKTSCCIFMP